MADPPNSPAPTEGAFGEKDASIHQQGQTHAVFTQNKEATNSLRKPHNETSRKFENQKINSKEDTDKQKLIETEDANSMTGNNSTEDHVQGETLNPECDEISSDNADKTWYTLNESTSGKLELNNEQIHPTFAENSSDKVESSKNTTISNRNSNGEDEEPIDITDQPRTQESNGRESVDGSETSESLNGETQDLDDSDNKHEFDQGNVNLRDSGNTSDKVENPNNVNISNRNRNEEDDVRSDTIDQHRTQESNGRESVDDSETSESLNGETQDLDDSDNKHEFDQGNVNLRDSGKTSDKVENPNNVNISNRNRNEEDDVRSDTIDQHHAQESNGRQSIDGSATTEKLKRETKDSEDLNNKHKFDQEHINSTGAGNRSDKVENFHDTNISDMSRNGKNEERSDIIGESHTQKSNDRESMNDSKSRENLDRQTKDLDGLNRQSRKISNNHTLRGDSLVDGPGEGMRVDGDDKLRSENISYSQMSCRSNGTQFHDSYTRTEENHKDNEGTAFEQENDSRAAEPLINRLVDTDGLNRNQREYDCKSNPSMDLSIDDLDGVLDKGYPDDNTFTERSPHDQSLQSDRKRCLQSDSNVNKGLHPFGDQFDASIHQQGQTRAVLTQNKEATNSLRKPHNETSRKFENQKIISEEDTDKHKSIETEDAYSMTGDNSTEDHVQGETLNPECDEIFSDNADKTGYTLNESTSGKLELNNEQIHPTFAENSSDKVESSKNTTISNRNSNGEDEEPIDITDQPRTQESNGRDSVDGSETSESLNGETQDLDDSDNKHEFGQGNVNLRDSGNTSDKVENSDNVNISNRNRNEEDEVRSDTIDQHHTQESNGRQSIDGSATTEKLNGETQDSEDLNNKHKFDQEHVNSIGAGNSSDKVENFHDTNISDTSRNGKNEERSDIIGKSHTQQSNDRESMNDSKSRENLDRQTKDLDGFNRQLRQMGNNHTLRGDYLVDSYGNSNESVNAGTGKFNSLYGPGEGMRVDEDDKLHSDNVSYSQMSCRSSGTQFHDSYTRTEETHKDNEATALKQENDCRAAEPLINRLVDTDGLYRNQRGYDNKSNPLIDLSIDDLDGVLNQGYPDDNTSTERSLHDQSLQSDRERCLQSDSSVNKGLHPFGDQFVTGLAIENDLERLRRERDARITLNEALQDEIAGLRIREKQNKEVIINTEYEKNSLRKQLDDAKKTIRTLNTVKDGLNRDVASLKEGMHVLEERLHKSEKENTIKDVIIDGLKTTTAELETKTQTLNESLSGKTKDIISLEANKKQLEEKFNRQSNEVEKIKKENATYCMEISSLKEHSRALQESENQYRGELEKIKKDHGLLKEEYRNMNVRLKSQSKHVNALETELEQKDKLIHRKESARQAAVDAMQRTQSEYQELSVRLQDMQSLRLQLQQEKAANHTANEQLISLRELLSGTEAMQKNVHVWWEEYKTAMNERKSEKADYERCRTKLQSVESELLYTKNERDSLKEGIRTYEVNNLKLNEHQHNLTTNLQNQVCQIANLSEEVKNRREAMETYRRQMEKLKEGSFELEKSLLKAESQIEGLKRDLSDREKEILMLRSQFSDHSDQGDDGGEDGGTSHSPDYGNQNDTTRNEGQAGLFSSHPSSTVHHRPPAAQNSASPHGQQNPHTTTSSIFGSQTFPKMAANNSFSPPGQLFHGANVQPSFFASPGIPNSFNFSGTNNFTSTPNNQA